MPRTPQRLRLTPRLRGYRLRVPRAAQRLIIDLPEVRDHMQAERYEMIVKAALAMESVGISLRRSARVLGVAVSTLVLLKERYARDGFTGLMRQRMGRVPQNRHAVRPARIIFALTR